MESILLQLGLPGDVGKVEEGKQMDHIELEALWLDGQTVDVEVVGASVPYQGKSATQAILRDTTERKRTEEKLEEYSNKLVEMIAERTRELKEIQTALIQSGAFSR